MSGGSTRLGDFSNQAASYARARPGYPAAMIDRLVTLVGVAEGDPVADIGAGTGIATALLARRGLSVSAIEPNSKMAAQASLMPGVTWHVGSFESIPLADRSQKWIVAAQAFHWARPDEALPELHRVLSPSGRLTAMWNDRANAQSELLQATCRIIREHVPEFDELYRGRDWSTILVSTGHFGEVVTDNVDHAVPMSLDRYRQLWHSHHLLNSLAGPERFAAIMRELDRILAAVSTEIVDIPYVCQAWTVRRLDLTDA